LTRIIERDGDWYIARWPGVPANGQGSPNDEARESLIGAVAVMVQDAGAEQMPPKVRELNAEQAGFVDRGGKGSHRNFVHPEVARPVTVSGRLGDDAKAYQLRAVRRALKEAKS